MADRRDYYKGQYVLEAELDAGFDGIERAQRDFAVDADLIGVASGGVVTQHAPTPDLTVDVAAMTAYDQQGRRLRIPSPQTLNLTTDSASVSTAVINPGNTKIVSIFVRFKRALSDPRTDLNGNPVDFVQTESFEFYVTQGAEAVSPTPPALESNGILIADVTRSFGVTQILNGAISTSRKQWQFIASAGSMAIAAGTAEAAVQAALTHLDNHVQGTANKHPATAVTYAGGSALADGLSTTGGAWATVEGAIDQLIGVLVTGLLDTRANISALTAIGSEPTIAAGTLRAGLLALKTAVNLYAPASGELSAGALSAQLAAIDVRVTGRNGTLADANATIQPQDVDHYKVPNTLATDRTLSLDPPTKEGRVVRFTRSNPDPDKTYTIKRTGGANLAVLPVVTASWVEVVARSGAWELSAWSPSAGINQASG